MLRHRLVRQSAVNDTMPSPQPVRRRRDSQGSKIYRQLSSESIEHLLEGPPKSSGGRRHSVACGAVYVDVQRPSIKAAFNTAVKRMSSACSVLSSAPSSTYNLSPHQGRPPPPKKEEEVLFPPVLETFRQSYRLPQVNRRFSTDCPPPSYNNATDLWKQPNLRQPKLARQQQLSSGKNSLVAAVEDDDAPAADERLVE